MLLAGAAGLTAKDMDDLSKSIGKNTLANADQVRDAAGALATFRNIGPRRILNNACPGSRP